jgi:hypothetical protein
VGHVFQGRYGARLCDRENYFLELVRYVHLNPYRVKSKRWRLAPEGWPWSSHRYYMEGNEPMAVRPWIHEVLRRFNESSMAQARRGYAEFLAEGLRRLWIWRGAWDETPSR